MNLPVRLNTHPAARHRRLLAHGLPLLLAPLALLSATAWAKPARTHEGLHVDALGYLPTGSKVAVVVEPEGPGAPPPGPGAVLANPASSAATHEPPLAPRPLELRRWADDAVVLRLTLQPWRAGQRHAQSGDRGGWADFSAWQTPGSYYLHDPQRGTSSVRFAIGPRVHNGLLRHALRTFYFQRLGQAHAAPHTALAWRDGPAYLGPQQDSEATSRHAKGDPHTARDLRGGWMDAGDPNKYTTFARDAVLLLLEAYRFNPSVFDDALGLPESGNGVPDLLDEVLWELAFLGRMQDASGMGGLLLKVGVDSHPFVRPLSRDTRPRYYVGECSSATLAGAAMFASAAEVLGRLPRLVALSQHQLSRAETAWERARHVTQDFQRFDTRCDDGDIKAGLADQDAATQWESALIAAIYLYAHTGEASYRDWVLAHWRQARPVALADWGPHWYAVQIALLRFASLPGVPTEVAQALRTHKLSHPHPTTLPSAQAGTDLYRAHLPDSDYAWGHTRIRAAVGNLNLDYLSFDLAPEHASAYRALAEQHLHWLHGVNPLGMAFLSNLGELGAPRSVQHLYHAAYGAGLAPPGFLVGGPNVRYSGSRPGLADQPPQRAYQDWNTGTPENAWEINEPSLEYQATYVLLLARLLAPGSDKPARTSTR